MKTNLLKNLFVISALTLFIVPSVFSAEIPAEKKFANSIGMKFVRIEPGVFMIGNTERGDFDERPVHKVNITKPFFMAATEVTNAQFEQYRPGFRKSSGKPDILSNGDDEAVIHVSWYDAVDYCKWLSEKEGKPYRLPTEAEWEYACRAGTTTAYNTGDEYPQERWRNQEIITGPRAGSLKVAEFEPNPWGLYDMHGNVEEWCVDWYGPYEPQEQTDPIGRVASEFRNTRGGSHSTLVKYLRSANRMAALPADKHWLIGFRVVIAEMPKTKPLPAVGPKLFAQNVSQIKHDWKPKVDMTKPYFKGPDKFIRQVEHPETIPMYGHNHLPCIKYCDNGDLLAMWFSTRKKSTDKDGVKVKNPDSNGERGREMTILASRLRLGSDKWDIPSEFYKVPDRNMTGSAIINDGRGRLHYFQGVSVAENWKINNILITKTSDDNGATWSPTRILQPDRGIKPCQPIDSAYCTDDGRLIVPNDWVGVDTGLESGATCLWISEDRGKTWTTTQSPIEGIHAAAVDFGKGKFMALGRHKAEKNMPKSITVDNGKTWKYSTIDLPGIGGGRRLVLRRLKEGPLLLVSFTEKKGKKENPNAGIDITDASGKVRRVYGMYTALSYDNGETWVNRKLVTTGGPAKKYDGGAWTREFIMDDNNSEPMGYMAGIQTPDGMFHLISSALHYQFNYQWLITPNKPEVKN